MRMNVVYYLDNSLSNNNLSKQLPNNLCKEWREVEEKSLLP